MPNLNDKQHIFVSAYIDNGGNASAAAVTAGYAPDSAAVTGYRMKNSPHIHAEIERRTTDLAESGQLDAATWLASVLSDIQLARHVKNLSAVMRGHELVGRAINVFADSTLTDKERAAFAFLGESMVDAIASNGGIDALTNGRMLADGAAQGENGDA